MAYLNSLNGRMEELRYPNMRSPEIDGSYLPTIASTRDANLFASGGGTAGADVRGTLQRRFTADSSKLSLGRSSFGQQYTSLNNASQMKQKQIYEDIQDARRKAQEQLVLLDLQERNLQLGSTNQDLDRLNNNYNRLSLNGPVSEPTTPPDYSEDVFSNRFSRSNRQSMNNITSPPGLTKRTSQSGSKVTSPHGTRLSTSALYQSHRQSTKSMPGSRRGSDEDEDYPETLPNIRSAAALNRFSMPVNGSRNSQTRLSMANPQFSGNLGQIDTSFLFDDNDGLQIRSPIADTYSALIGQNGGDFPVLRKEGDQLSANSAALDLANSRDPVGDSWILGSRKHPGHSSMPQSDSSMYRPDLSNLTSPVSRHSELPRRQSQRHSMGVTFDDKTVLPPTTMSSARPSSLQSSYSTNDVHTMKSLGLDTMVTPPKSHAEQAFHNHNISMGRIPLNAINNRQSREVGSSNGMMKSDEKASLAMSNLQASAAPFGPAFTSTSDANVLGMTSPSESYNPQPFQYNMQNYNVSQVNGQTQTNGQLVNYQNMSQMNSTGSFNRADGQGRGAAARRGHDDARFNNVPLESYRGQLYELCKDQHGCRYLQRKLEDGNPEHIEAIFTETCPHITELMTDPFGNYLCQKLFEHCNDDQRSTLIDTAAPRLSIIALNQHGTRALQKMIEFVHTDEQINTIIAALSPRVVELVQDLNGNHVIQKCLTRLGAQRSQFIYDAVGQFCVVVGTHRHGCCVLQRCIDHARGAQRAQLIAQITQCAFDLVQDPFGNYVVQYILDLDEPSFTRPLCQSFQGNFTSLSKQKFSSNVMEKVLRVADQDTKREMIDEMMMGNELEKMLKDSYANYVVQTALDYADANTKPRMIEMLRPVLQQIKSTPHGRRIANKIVGMGNVGNGITAPPVSPPEQNFTSGRSANRRQIQINGGGFVYGGRGYPTPEFPAETYGTGQPGNIHPLGYNPMPMNYSNGNGTNANNNSVVNNNYENGHFGNNYI